MTEQPLDLLATFKMLRDALDETRVDHAFIGALPVIAWGRVRTTTDLDLVIAADPAQHAKLDRALLTRGAVRGRGTGPADPGDAIPDIAAYWHAHQPGAPSVRIDLFIGKTAFERSVLSTARKAMVLGAPVPVARPEASIIYKLLAHRGRDVDDVDSIFENRTEAKESLDWVYLDDWARAWEIVDRLAPYKQKYGAR